MKHLRSNSSQMYKICQICYIKYILIRYLLSKTTFVKCHLRSLRSDGGLVHTASQCNVDDLNFLLVWVQQRCQQ